MKNILKILLKKLLLPVDSAVKSYEHPDDGILKDALKLHFNGIVINIDEVDKIDHEIKILKKKKKKLIKGFEKEVDGFLSITTNKK